MIVNVSMRQIAQSVFFYLGVPFLPGCSRRFVLLPLANDGMVRKRVCPPHSARVNPCRLARFTIVRDVLL